MKKVAILFSGGVDSLVATHLLKNRGFDVEAFYFSTGYEEKGIASKISKITSSIKINLTIVDVTKEFKQKVVNYFIKEYLSGRTPNPCLICNSSIKFNFLLEFVKKRGFEFLATGHYASLKNSNLFKALDKKKDQSYFLGFVKKENLKNVIFPLADMTKEEVLDYAKINSLEPVFSKESQDICFIKEKSYKDFLKTKKIFSKEGNIKTIQGEIIGKHKGLVNYTIGQRKNLNCPAKAPYYVTKIDTKNNELILGFREDIFKKECTIKNLNLFDKNLLSQKQAKLKTKLRYRNKEATSFVFFKEESAKIEFEKEQFAITPGQGAVFYDGDRVVGAGIIE